MMRSRARLVASLLAGALVVGTISTIAGGTAGARGGSGTSSGTDGGSVTFALEAETSAGYCVPDGTLAPSGIQVAAAIYDTLTAINLKGETVPYLAKSFEPNADFT
jgi:peptide/nickel transport system substrate-binding protein